MLNTQKTKKRHNGNCIIFLTGSPGPLITFIEQMSGNAFSFRLKNGVSTIQTGIYIYLTGIITENKISLRAGKFSATQ